MTTSTNVVATVVAASFWKRVTHPPDDLDAGGFYPRSGWNTAAGCATTLAPATPNAPSSGPGYAVAMRPFPAPLHGAEPRPRGPARARPAGRLRNGPPTSGRLPAAVREPVRQRLRRRHRPDTHPAPARRPGPGGTTRVLFGMLDAKSASIGAPDLTVNVGLLRRAKSTTEPVATAPAKFMWAIQDQRGIYEVTTTFADPGDWIAEFTSTRAGPHREDAGAVPGLGHQLDAAHRRQGARHEDADPRRRGRRREADLDRHVTRTPTSTSSRSTTRSPSTSRSCSCSRRPRSARARSVGPPWTR